MQIHPALRALWDDPVPQRQAQAAIEAAKLGWRQDADIARFLVELERYGEGADLASLGALSELVNRGTTARTFVEGLVRSMTDCLAREPFAQVPFRHQYSERTAVLQLARSGRATLSLISYGFAEGANAQTACFGSGDRHEVCIAGCAEIRRISIVEVDGRAARLSQVNQRIGFGSSMSFRNHLETKVIDRIGPANLVLLRLSRDADDPLPSREYRISDGMLVHQASGDRTESRNELAMAVLGAMGRVDAVPAMREIASEGSPHLRWQAIRQSVSLDPREGFAALSAIAADTADELSTPAEALRTQLAKSHPQLEQTVCPA